MKIPLSAVKRIGVIALIAISVVVLGLWIQNSSQNSQPEEVQEPTKADLNQAPPSASGPIAEVVRNPQIGQSITVEGTIITFPDENSFAISENNASIVIQKAGADQTLQAGDTVLVTGTISSGDDGVYIDSDSVEVTGSIYPTPTPTTSEPITASPTTATKDDSYVAPTPTPAFSLTEQQVRGVAEQHTEGGSITSIQKVNEAGTLWRVSLVLPDSTTIVLTIAVQGTVITVTED